jgi:hypothetical protein
MAFFGKFFQARIFLTDVLVQIPKLISSLRLPGRDACSVLEEKEAFETSFDTMTAGIFRVRENIFISILRPLTPKTFFFLLE